jgi:hypothetical protein
MNTEIIDNEINLLYNQSLDNPQIIPPYFIDGNEDYICEVETYESLEGNGFRIVGRLKENGKTYIRIKNYGPDVNSERAWQELFIPSYIQT